MPIMELGARDSVIDFAQGTADDPWLERFLTINGVAGYALTYSCGTCGLVLRRQPGAPPLPIAAEGVRDRLNSGLSGLDADVISAFGGQLPRGEYLVVLLRVEPVLTQPGSRSDYFAVEQPRLWTQEDVEEPDATDPANIPYYRLGDQPVGERHHLFQFAVPMRPLDSTDEATVSRYAEADTFGTAVSLGVLDVSGPYFSDRQHWGLFHFLLDGHHKLLAAARAGRPLRLLSFVSVGRSLASRDDFAQFRPLVER
ncbi:hypothetical protein [Nonomuraea sp. NPDC050310]|uniref:hypothetical protein n=1 Tax=Nonomuraea sp. NPDC050310 TaxID=3154935 RepID=UPI0033CD4100